MRTGGKEVRAGEAGGDPLRSQRVGAGILYIFPSLQQRQLLTKVPCVGSQVTELHFLMPSDLEPCLHTRFFNLLQENIQSLESWHWVWGTRNSPLPAPPPAEHFKSLASPECRLIKIFYIFIIKIGLYKSF